MPISFMPYAPDQELLLPHSLHDWLPAGHLANYISDTVDALDLRAFFIRYDSGGPRNQPFHPAMMVKVLVYGYATGVFSSRKIARKLHEDVAFRVLAADNFPKHRTLSDFRALHLQELGALFVQIVKLAGECGLLKLGTIAVDGTKLRANASKHKAMSYERMQVRELELKAQVQALLERAKQADVAEAGEPELDIPAEIERREQRVKVIQAAKQRLEERQHAADTQSKRKPDEKKEPPEETPEAQPAPNAPPEKQACMSALQPTNPVAPVSEGATAAPAQAKVKRAFGQPLPKAQENFTDPSSRIMKTSSGGFEQCFNGQTAVDSHRQIIVAAELTACANDRAELPCMVAAAQSNTGLKPGVVLADAGYLSEAVLAQLSADDATRNVEVLVALGREGKRQVAIDTDKRPLTAAMAVKLQSADGQAKYRRRKAVVEPPNAWIKQVLGFRQFSFRGIDKVRAEFKLVCAALNLRRMAGMLA